MTRRFCVRAVFWAAVLVAAGHSVGADSPGYTSTIPSFDVRFSAGFNYDLLRSPTDVSFERSEGYMGINLPIGMGGDLQTVPVSGEMLDDLFEDNTLFRRGDNFRPSASASQNPNVTVRVDVPMLYGVGSFAYTQNFFMNFNTAIGGSSVISSYTPINDTIRESDAVIGIDGFLSLKGGLRIPLAFNFGWETMTLGYAYRVAEKDDLIFAFNLHRHLFSMNVRARADIDLLGHLNLSASGSMKTAPGVPDLNVTVIPPTSEDIIDFNSETCNGSAQGRYRAETWTPSFGVKLWRVSLASRFGIDTRAKGSINGRFAVPKIVDIETGELSQEYDDLVNDLSGEGGNPKRILDKVSENGVGGLISQEMDSIVYETTEALRWKMPSGHTIACDIIPNRLSVSYTKLFGEVAMRLDNFSRTKTAETGKETIWEDVDTLNFDVGVTVDHIMMLHVNFPRFFINAGLCGFDIRSGDDRHIIGNIYEENGLGSMRLGKAVMLPVLNGGVTVGKKVQLRVEADILPMPALKTGFHYYF